MGKFVDLTGQRFGRLVVVSRKPNNEWRNSMWLCKCDCGKTTITSDRIDNNGNYSPENCRWTTKKEQARNRRTTVNNRLITYNGETHTVFEWLKLLGIRSIHYEGKED